MITSAFGRESAKKSIGCAETRSPTPDACDLSCSDCRCLGEIRRDASHMGMRPGDQHRQLSGRAADVAQGLVACEIERVRERLEVARRDSRHGLHELFEPFRLAVQLTEHRGAAVLRFVLRLAGPQRRGQVSPEGVEPRVRHFQKAAHVSRTLLVEEERGIPRIPIAAFGAIAVTLQKLERHQRIEEVGICPLMQTEGLLELGARHCALSQGREQSELDSREQGLGRPECHADFHDPGGGHRCHCGSLSMSARSGARRGIRVSRDASVTMKGYSGKLSR